jgi:hypothetical protein
LRRNVFNCGEFSLIQQKKKENSFVALKKLGKKYLLFKTTILVGGKGLAMTFRLKLFLVLGFFMG